MGTGLGLAIAARIVEKHGGALEFQTQLNHGTTFGIVLPQAK
jgi:signal transduction histidine kinase